MKKYILISLLGIFGALSAQNLSLDYYSYLNNEFNINPAYTGKEENVSGVINHRQKAGISSANSMVGIRAAMGDNEGVGIRLISDNRGAFSANKLDITYGHKFMITKDHRLYFGMSAGVFNSSMNVSKINNFSLLDATDPVLQESNLDARYFIAGAGACYAYKDFEFSVSAPELVDGLQKVNGNLYMFASYDVKAAMNVVVTPALYYFNVPVVKNLFGVEVKGEMNGKYWAQMGFTTNKKFNIGVGARFSTLGIGYTFHTPNSLMKEHTPGMHEVIFIVGMKKTPIKRKSKTIRSSIDPNAPPASTPRDGGETSPK
jgi:type IX secretion system PorP/SprF family membrane protein